MARFPCEGCGQRYRGKQSTFYPALLSGAIEIREKRRLCRNCGEQLLTLAQAIQDGSELAPYPQCGLCDEDGDVSFFVTHYSEQSGFERADLGGRVCARCAASRVGPTVYGGKEALLPLDTALLRVEAAPGVPHW